MPRVFRVDNALKAEHHIVGIQRARGRKPAGVLKLHFRAQAKTPGNAIVRRLPAFGEFRHQPVSIRINIQQPVIELCGERIYRQPAARFLRVKGINLAINAIDKAALANIAGRFGERRSKSRYAQQPERR